MTDPLASKMFVLYDERARGGNTDEALVLCCAQSMKEARRDKRTMFPNAVIVEYDVVPSKAPGQNDQLVNEVIHAD